MTTPTSAVASVVDRLSTNLQSGRVLATIAGIGAVALLAGLLVRRRGAGLAWQAVAVAVPVLLAGGLLVAPYFQQRELSEDLLGEAAMPLPAVAIAPTTMATTTASPLPTPSAVRLDSAELRGLGGHGASGTIALYRLANGSTVLRFEDVDIEGTPTPRVYLVPGGGKERPGGTDLGELRAERGSFNYELPTEPASPVTVLVWCDRFAVPIAGGTLT